MTLSRRDLAAVATCVTLWGVNFVVIDDGLKHFPPLLFVALRFFFTAVPAVFFVPRPQVGWRVVTAVGLLACVGQFGCLFVAMNDGLPAGLASVVIQSQALFTVAFAAALLRERATARQLAGLTVATAGMVTIAAARAASVPLAALLLCVAGGASWGAANIVTRASRPARPVSLLVYSALVAPLPLTGLSLLTEGPHADLHALRTVDLAALFSLAFVVVGATFIGFGLWYFLLARHASNVVAPFALLVPVVGITAAWALLGERPHAPELAGAVATVLGLAYCALAVDRNRGNAALTSSPDTGAVSSPPAAGAPSP